jgi:hypothetical protein
MKPREITEWVAQDPRRRKAEPYGRAFNDDWALHWRLSGVELTVRWRDIPSYARETPSSISKWWLTQEAETAYFEIRDASAVLQRAKKTLRAVKKDQANQVVP